MRVPSSPPLGKLPTQAMVVAVVIGMFAVPMLLIAGLAELIMWLVV